MIPPTSGGLFKLQALHSHDASGAGTMALLDEGLAEGRVRYLATSGLHCCSFWVGQKQRDEFGLNQELQDCWEWSMMLRMIYDAACSTWHGIFFFFLIKIRLYAKSLQSCLTLCNSMDCRSLAPLSMRFSTQEYWSELSCPLPGDLPNPEIKSHLLCLLHWHVGSLPLAPPGKLKLKYTWFIMC